MVLAHVTDLVGPQPKYAIEPRGYLYGRLASDPDATTA